jgi:hypothetical protein
MLVVQLISGTILSALVTFAWAYVTVVTVSGWIAGEHPRRAWAVAAIGVSILFAIRLIFPVLGIVPFDPQTVPVFSVIAYASYAAWLMLAAGFVLGLPTPAAAAADEAADEAPGDSATGDPRAATQPGSAAG